MIIISHAYNILVGQKILQIDKTQVRAIKLAESTLQLSNLDLVASFVLRGDKSSQMSVTSSLRNEIIDPAASVAEVSA